MDPLIWKLDADCERLVIDLPSGVSLRLDRDMAIAIREAISAALPEMAVKID